MLFRSGLIRRHDGVVIPPLKYQLLFIPAGPPIEPLGMRNVDQVVVTGMEDQGPAGETFHLSLLMKILPHCDSEGVHGGADLMGFNPDKYPVQRVRQATLDDEPRRVLFQIRKRVFPCLPTCKVFLEKVKVLALML